MGFAPAAAIEAPIRRPFPYGLFSVVSLAEQATERWENGVEWEALSCSPAGVLIGDCDASEGFPKTFAAGSRGTAQAFTVYGTYKCSTMGGTLERAQENARTNLLNREEAAAESRLWKTIARSNPTIVTVASGDMVDQLGALEKFIRDTYGSLGVIHVSANAATTLAQKGNIVASGNQMFTLIGTPVLVGTGYPGTGAAIKETQTLSMTGTVTGGTFTLTFAGQTTAPIPWNATAAQVVAALTALNNINAGDVTATGGPLPGTPVVVTFGGQYAGTDVPLMTTNSAALTGTSPAAVVTAGTAGSYTAPAANTEFIAATPALFGYRSQIFEGTARPGDLLDRSVNNLYGIAERNYLIGMEPCGVAMAQLPLGCC